MMRMCIFKIILPFTGHARRILQNIREGGNFGEADEFFLAHENKIENRKWKIESYKKFDGQGLNFLPIF